MPSWTCASVCAGAETRLRPEAPLTYGRGGCPLGRDMGCSQSSGLNADASYIWKLEGGAGGHTGVTEVNLKTRRGEHALTRERGQMRGLEGRNQAHFRSLSLWQWGKNLLTPKGQPPKRPGAHLQGVPRQVKRLNWKFKIFHSIKSSDGFTGEFYQMFKK